MSSFTNRFTGLASLAIVLAGLAAGGCVKQGNYDNLYESNRALEARNQELMEMLRTREATIADLQARINSAEATFGSTSSTVQQLRDQLARMKEEYAALAARLANIQFGPLDAATDEALQQLAAQYPDQIEYDSARGVIRFKSDITFSSGSYELSASGQQAVAALGRVLGQLPSAQQYDVVVVGHTDAQRVRQVSGRRFINNDELSAFRAISVTSAIGAGGVDKRRLMFAGFGESRPAVPNSGSGNTPANRRVEVFLTRSLPTGGVGAESGVVPPGGASAPANPAANPDFMK
ncbi:MAG: OmpA family protein [Phycisphaerales bacterium]